LHDDALSIGVFGSYFEVRAFRASIGSVNFGELLSAHGLQRK